MKREILFRAKRVDNGDFIEGDLVHQSFDLLDKLVDIGIRPKMDECYYCTIAVILETVGQFTGLTDKNGVKIFEGDILCIKEFLNTAMDLSYKERNLFELNDLKGDLCKKYVTDIIYESGSFAMKTGTDDYNCYASVLEGDQRHSYPIFEFEVIGNIHDNPELLV